MENSWLQPKMLIGMAAFVIPLIGSGLVLYGKLEEKVLNVESQMSNLNLPDTTELRERLTAVEEKAFYLGKELDSFELWVNDQLELLNENPLNSNY